MIIHLFLDRIYKLKVRENLTMKSSKWEKLDYIVGNTMHSVSTHFTETIPKI